MKVLSMRKYWLPLAQALHPQSQSEFTVHHDCEFTVIEQCKACTSRKWRRRNIAGRVSATIWVLEARRRTPGLDCMHDASGISSNVTNDLNFDIADDRFPEGDWQRRHVHHKLVRGQRTVVHRSTSGFFEAHRSSPLVWLRVLKAENSAHPLERC